MPPPEIRDLRDLTRLRSLVNSAFSARVISSLKPRVEEIVASLIDAVQDSGSMDVVADLAYPLPVTVICEMLAVSHWPIYLRI